MSDYGFRVTRDGCGKHSVPKTVDRGWKIEDMRTSMKKLAEKEAEEYVSKNEDGVSIIDGDPDVIELREKGSGLLIAYYEVEEFEHR